MHWLVVATIVALITMCSIGIRKNDLISCAIAFLVQLRICVELGGEGSNVYIRPRAAITLVPIALFSVVGSIGVTRRRSERDWITSVVVHFLFDECQSVGLAVTSLQVIESHGGLVVARQRFPHWGAYGVRDGLAR